MVHHYLRTHYGDNCFFPDSKLKIYNRYHDSKSTMIFNFGGGCCGGGYTSYGCCGGGSFWGGFGAGIGAGIANLFGGFMNGFMGMPFMNMWGGNMWDCGMPWAAWWGGGAGTTPATTSSSSSSSSSSSTDDGAEVLGDGGAGTSTTGAGNVGSNNGNGNTVIKDDPDVVNLNRLRTALRAELAQATPDTAELKKLYDEIKVLTTTPLDDNTNTDGNKIGYQQLLDEFNKYCSVDSGGNVTVNPLDSTDPADLSKINDLYRGLNLPSDVTPKDLFDHGIRPTLLPNGTLGLTLPKTIDKKGMELLAKSGQFVAFEHRSKSKDKWIIGKIGDVQADTNDKLTLFTIDCMDYPDALYKAKYTLTLAEDQSWDTNISSESSHNEQKRTFRWDPNRGLYINDGEAHHG